MEARDQRRWGLADENGDGELTKLEFKHFLHPEEVEHMKDLVVQETIDDIDKVNTIEIVLGRKYEKLCFSHSATKLPVLN